MSNVYREARFSEKNIYKWAKHGFSTTSLSQKKKTKKKTIYKHTDSLEEKKFQVQ